MKNINDNHRDEILALNQRIAELETTQAKLKEEVNMYRGIVDNAAEGIFRVTSEGQILDINPAAATILEYESREDCFSTVKHVEDICGIPQERQEALELIKKNGFLKDFAIRGRCKNGGTKWVTVNVRIVRDKNGKLLYNEGTFQDIDDRKKLEHDFLESKKFSRTLIDFSLNNIMYLMDINGIVLECNQTVPRRLGIHTDELIGKCIFDFIPPDVAKIRKEKIREMIETKQSVQFENVVYGRWYDNTGYPILDEHGNVAKVVAFGYDITDRKRAEEERDLILNSSVDLICIAGFDGYFKYVNPAWEKVLGYSTEELLSRPFLEITHADDRLKSIRQLEQLVSGQRARDFTSRCVHKDGSARTFIWTATPVLERNSMYCMGKDITERVVAEEELRIHRDHLEKLVEERTEEINREIMRRKEKEEQYLSLVESIVEWVWETDENSCQTYISPRVTELLGYKQEECIGKRPYDYMVEDVPRIKKLVSQRRPFVFAQFSVKHKDGHIVLIEGSGRPYFDKSGKFKGYRGSCRDITEQKRTMDMLRRHEADLVVKSETLREVNAALRVLLKQREDDKRELEETFVGNIKEMILPYINKMRKDRIEFQHKAYLDIISTNLNEIMAPFLSTIRQLNFTPKEIEVASLIKDGKTTKEIAEIMGVATSAIDSHRNNIRTKLGLINKDVNLRSYLLSFK